ncbi:DUF423 domain-containing protein [Flagellimonas pacifica]|uniref:Uncharacterized membrane protein YgdD, TMEM256/DUF423 family n=1 Tax=Flagellimonas pacifica TaxID=1247520 RepID=A0A285MBQ3_9FLAO|nr:DUF423 domain-containing protein [Allomuricauda parva]SNY94622.1 Uncharacterized membrane protein YgdD, TMEM256/DUF423 family [Allomuricauda parva]
MNKTILATATGFGLLAIILGAFGAHGLEKVIEKTAVETFETGVRYQMYHAFFLLFLGMWDGMESNRKKVVFLVICIGILFFSFSIYLLAINELTSFDFKKIGFITPIGGSILIAGWAIFGYYILRDKTHK